MAYEPKDGSGALFRNDKGDNDKRPDYRGNLMVGGVEYELSSWIKEGQKGKWMSISAKPKEERQSQQKAPQTAPGKASGGHLDDDVPFMPRHCKEG